MIKILVSVVVLSAAISCLLLPIQSTAQSLTPAGHADARFISNTAPQPAPFQPAAFPNTQPRYPIPRTMYEEVIAKYRIASGHKAIYANVTGNQMWSLVQSTSGQPSQQSAIAEARQACEAYAVQSNLNPGKCVPVAVDDRQVFNPGALFSAAESAQDLQANLSALETQPRE